MISPAAEIQQQIAIALEASGAFAGIYDDAPARTPFPYVIVICNSEDDWSCLNREGRELRFELVLWDDEPSRIATLDERVSRLIPLALSVPGWDFRSLHRLSKKRTRNPAGPWSSTLVLRVRLLRLNEEELA